MDKITSGSQAGGRPPEKDIKSINPNVNNSFGKANGNTPGSQTGSIPRKTRNGNINKISSNTIERLPKKSTGTKLRAKAANNNLANELLNAVFEEDSSPPTISATDSSPLTISATDIHQESMAPNNNVNILEDIALPRWIEVGSLENNMEYETNSNSSIDDEFKIVNNKKRRFEGDVKLDLKNFNFKKLDKVDTSVNRSNKYSLLGELDIESERNVDNVNKIDNRNNSNPPKKLGTRNSFCPPIFLQNVNVKSLVDQLKLKGIEFKIQNQSKYKSKLYLKDASAHSEMMQLLREKEIVSYSYTPREFKRQSIVCRGLYYRSDVNEIKQELDKIVPDTIDSVSKFSTEYSKRQGIDTGLFLVTLKTDRRVKEILGIKYILNQVVSWERPKASTKIPQCWRCQLWGHFSRNCNRPFACIKCDKKHAPGECAYVLGSGVAPFCVNCKENGHTSNFRGCPAYKRYVSLRKKSLEASKARKNLAVVNVDRELALSNVITSGRSFASLLGNSNASSVQNKPGKPAIIEEFMKIARMFCDPEPISLEDRIRNFLVSYKTLSKDQARKECLSLMKDIQNVYGP